MAKDRAYDPKRRPNIFYKNDPASDDELYNRASARKQMIHQEKGSSISDEVSKSIGIQKGLDLGTSGGPEVSRGGKALSNISISNGKNGGSISGGSSTNMPISGTQLGKWHKAAAEAGK